MQSILDTKLPYVEITLHAVDRLSERCLNVWKNEAVDGVGLMSFFLKKCREAYALFLRLTSSEVSFCKVTYQGVTYVFRNELGLTKLITAYPDASMPLH